MLTVTFKEKAYEFDLQEALSSLTGTESMLVEDYLGGWHRFREPGNITRSTIVMVWLAKRSAGETTTFEEIAATPGLVFGDAVIIEGDPDDPEDPAEPPARPLAERSASNGLSDGSDDAASTQATSGSSGPQPLLASTD